MVIQLDDFKNGGWVNSDCAVEEYEEAKETLVHESVKDDVFIKLEEKGIIYRAYPITEEVWLIEEDE